MNDRYRDYLRSDAIPTVWCPGCGNGVIIRALIDAVRTQRLTKDEVVVVGGIGCSGRTPYFLDFNTMHTTHGRAPAFGTGVKMARPDLTVILAMGDGDSVGIGGNHFIHACRRNIDMTAVVFNNEIYGLTGGQVAPTTSANKRTATTPTGNTDPAFDISKLAETAGATFVARTTTFDFQQLNQFMSRAIAHKGFSVVEVMTPCPTYLGRMNSYDDPYETLGYMRDTTVRLDSGFSSESSNGEQKPELQRPLGIFVEDTRPEYTEQYFQRSKQLQDDG